MKVKEIAKLIPDQIIIYKQICDSMNFKNLYKGDSASVPSDEIGDMEIRTIGAARKRVIDIQVN